MLYELRADFGEVNWTVEDGLTRQEIKEKLDELNEDFAGNIAIHKKTGNYYRISGFSVLNQQGKAELAVNYHPFDNESMHDYLTTKYVRPASEFFDGRFIY